MEKIEERIREIVKEELATALKEKITFQIQYADESTTNSTTNENETTENNNQASEEVVTNQETTSD